MSRWPYYSRPASILTIQGLLVSLLFKDYLCPYYSRTASILTIQGGSCPYYSRYLLILGLRVFTPRSLYAQGYGEEEEREWYDEDGSNGRTGKHKSRTISVNPTEGFQYSDVYFVSRLTALL